MKKKGKVENDGDEWPGIGMGSSAFFGYCER